MVMMEDELEKIEKKIDNLGPKIDKVETDIATFKAHQPRSRKKRKKLKKDQRKMS
jgi:hypothetical protein